jgi:hypothetical protein
MAMTLTLTLTLTTAMAEAVAQSVVNPTILYLPVAYVHALASNSVRVSDNSWRL